MKMKFANRMNQFGEGIFTVLSDKKKEKLGKGETIVDLSIGAPNIPPAKHIVEALCEAAKDPQNYVYAIKDQTFFLEAIAGWYEKRYNVALDAQTEVLSFFGSQEGLSHMGFSLVNEGDIVLVPDPCYPVFADGPLLAGAKLYYMPQKKEHNYIIQLNEIPEEVAKKAKFMVVSYPNNPTTAMAPDSFYEELVAFAKKYDIIVIHDNAYSELVFDGKTTGSFLHFPGAKEVGVEFNSLSKTYGLAGARIGVCVGNPEIISVMKQLKSNMDYGMFLPLQHAAVAAVTGDQTCVKETCKAYELRRDILCDGLNQIGWDIEKPVGTMFVWAKVPVEGMTSEQFVFELLERCGVLVTPGSAFGPSGEGYVRMALVQEEKELKQAIDAINRSGILRG